MTDKDIRILIIESESAHSSPIPTLLESWGMDPVSAPSSVNLSSVCSQQHVDLIIVDGQEKSGLDFFLRPDLPQTIPILGLGMSERSCSEFGGIASCLPDNISEENIRSQMALLSRMKNLSDELTNQKDAFEKLKKRFEEQQQSMELHNEFLEIVALRDGLTGLFNRRHLNTLLPKELEKAVVNYDELTLLLLDIDYFYELNKSAGSSFGDFVLNDFAARLTAASQPDGICFRFSGGTFGVLLRGKNLLEAGRFADSIQENLRDHAFVRDKKERLITVSIGIVSLIDHQPQSHDTFITMAEEALFLAKSDGRNRAAVYQKSNPGQTETSHRNLDFLRETLSRILARTRSSSVDSIQLLARDIGGNKNRGHIENVRNYIDLLGSHMNLPATIVDTFKNATTLHTSIRFLLHNEMISKAELFTDDDREIMADFPYKLAELTKMFDYFANERDILLYHGERYDGSGYPDGLAGDEIPLGARLFALVDALAAMNEERPHRPRLKPEKILDELVNGAGNQFDPELVLKVLEIIRDHQLLELDVDTIDHAITRLN